MSHAECAARDFCLEVLHINCRDLDLQTLQSFLDWETAYREQFGEAAALLVLCELATLGAGAATAFVRALTMRDEVASLDVAICLTRLDLARSNARLAGFIDPPAPRPLSTRDRVRSLVARWAKESQ